MSWPSVAPDVRSMHSGRLHATATPARNADARAGGLPFSSRTTWLLSNVGRRDQHAHCMRLSNVNGLSSLRASAVAVVMGGHPLHVIARWRPASTRAKHRGRRTRRPSTQSTVMGRRRPPPVQVPGRRRHVASAHLTLEVTRQKGPRRHKSPPRPWLRHQSHAAQPHCTILYLNLPSSSSARRRPSASASRQMGDW